MPDLETQRLFLAIDLGPATKKSLVRIQRQLQKIPCEIKWVNEKNIHLTLKFYGNASNSQGDGIKKMMFDLAGFFGAEQLNLSRIGCFPSMRQPRVIWISDSKDLTQLTNLAKKIDIESLRLGFKKEERPFLAHITLGRIRSEKNALLLADEIKRLNKTLLPQKVPLDNLTLFSSTLSSTDPVYAQLHQVHLKKGALTKGAFEKK